MAADRAARWLDITVPIRSDMVTYEGDPAVCFERAASIAGGDTANVSRLDFGVHTATHVDAPVHFIEGAPGVESLDPEALIGGCAVIDATKVRANLDENILRGLPIPEGAARILFKTTNSRLWDRGSFSPDFIGITEDGARYLLGRGARLVGIDYLSVAPYGDPGPTHRALLEARCVILEGLDLRHVEPGPYELLALPLLIPGSDGGPTRAFLRR